MQLLMYRIHRTREPMLATDATWETNRNPRLPKPRWTLIQHSKRNANVKLKREGSLITFVARRDLPEDTTYFYDYGANSTSTRNRTEPRGRCACDSARRAQPDKRANQ